MSVLCVNIDGSSPHHGLYKKLIRLQQTKAYLLELHVEDKPSYPNKLISGAHDLNKAVIAVARAAPDEAKEVAACYDLGRSTGSR